MSAEKSMRCLYCNKRIWRFSFKQGSFCSELHEAWYQEEQSGEAIRRLLEPLESDNPEAAAHNPQSVSDREEPSSVPPPLPLPVDSVANEETQGPPLADVIPEWTSAQAPTTELAVGFGPEEWLPRRALPFSYVGPLPIEDAPESALEVVVNEQAAPQAVNGDALTNGQLTTELQHTDPPLAGLILNIGSAAAPPENVAFVIEDPIELPVPLIPFFAPAKPATYSLVAGPVALTLAVPVVQAGGAYSLPEAIEISSSQPVFPPLPDSPVPEFSGQLDGAAPAEPEDTLEPAPETPRPPVGVAAEDSEPAPLQPAVAIQAILPPPFQPEIPSTATIKPFAPRFAAARFSTRRPLLPPKTGHGYLARHYPFALPLSQGPPLDVVTHELFSSLRRQSAVVGDQAAAPPWDLEVGIAWPKWSVPPARQLGAGLPQAPTIGLTSSFAMTRAEVEFLPALSQFRSVTPGPGSFVSSTPIALRLPIRIVRSHLEVKPALVKPRVRRAAELLAAQPEIRPPRTAKPEFTGTPAIFGRVTCDFAPKDVASLPQMEAPALSAAAKVRPLLPQRPAENRISRGLVVVAHPAAIGLAATTWIARSDGTVCAPYRELAPKVQNPSGERGRVPGLESSRRWFLTWRPKHTPDAPATIPASISIVTGVQIPAARLVYSSVQLAANAALPATWATRKSRPVLADAGAPSVVPLARKAVQLPGHISFFAPQAGTVRSAQALGTAPAAFSLPCRVADVVAGERRFSATARIAVVAPAYVGHGIRGLSYDPVALTWAPSRFISAPLPARSVFRLDSELRLPVAA